MPIWCDILRLIIVVINAVPAESEIRDRNVIFLSTLSYVILCFVGDTAHASLTLCLL